MRWYLRYELNFRDLVEMRSERGLQLAHTTILRWVQRQEPEYIRRWVALDGSLVAQEATDLYFGDVSPTSVIKLFKQ